MSTDPDRRNVPIKAKTQKILLKAKHKASSKVGRNIGWDEFLTDLLKRKS